MKKCFKKMLANSILLVMLIGGLPIPAMAKEVDKLPTGITEQELEQAINDLADDYIGSQIKGAAISISKGNQVIFSKGYGYGDMENTASVDPEKTVFEWGSITKTFT